MSYYEYPRPRRRPPQDAHFYHHRHQPEPEPVRRPARSRSRHGRSSSTASSRTPLPTAPQPTLGERAALARQRLQAAFETHVFNTLPTHLVRIADMTLVTRNDIWDTFKPRIDALPDSHLAKLLLEQDEQARKLGVSAMDPDVLAPFSEYVRSMITFAVFSHKWGTGEPLFHELPNKRFQTTRRSAPSGPGYHTLAKFCEKATSDYGCEYAWSDTCCINRESSTELEEAILSMGLWFSEAGICVVHLEDSSTLDDFMSDTWFTRGWSLPELLLPRRIRFYGKDWSPICPAIVEARREDRAAKDNRDEQRINDKDNDSVVAAVAKVTGIPETDVRSFVPSCTRVAEKMRWASQRTTSRLEDMAYSLLGLFDVTMPIAYGEGPRAFHKLMSTLADQYTEPDLFAWAGKPSQWSLALPGSPQCYAPQNDLAAPPSALGDPAYEITKLGLRVRLVLVPAYCEPLEQTDIHTTRFLLAPALAMAQEPIQVHVPAAVDPREIQAGARGREFTLGVVDYDVRPGPPGYAALHAGRAHLCLVLERERRGRGWVRVTRPGALNVRFRESDLFPVESVCLLHRA